METKGPSIGRIFWTDYTTFILAISILLSGGFYLFDRFIQPIALSDELPYIVAFACLIGIPVITWRIRLITSAFEYGWEVEGDILDVGFFRDRGRVTYVYTVLGERYQSSNAIMKHRITKSLQRGQKAIVVANRDNPKVAFLRDLYT
jgi:hypothetical protein